MQGFISFAVPSTHDTRLHLSPIAQRAGRVRSLSQTVRVVDEETRTAARTIRLEILEADNYGDDALGAAADDDEEFYVDDEAVGAALLPSVPAVHGSCCALSFVTRHYTSLTR